MQGSTPRRFERLRQPVAVAGPALTVVATYVCATRVVRIDIAELGRVLDLVLRAVGRRPSRRRRRCDQRCLPAARLSYRKSKAQYRTTSWLDPTSYVASSIFADAFRRRASTPKPGQVDYRFVPESPNGPTGTHLIASCVLGTAEVYPTHDYRNRPSHPAMRTCVRGATPARLRATSGRRSPTGKPADRHQRGARGRASGTPLNALAPDVGLPGPRPVAVRTSSSAVALPLFCSEARNVTPEDAQLALAALASLSGAAE